MSNALHLDLIRELMAHADRAGLPLWLQGGWAIDARLGRLTREHGDIDLAFPGERRDEMLALLRCLGGGAVETTEYGFLMRAGDVLLDCEPAARVPRGDGDVYELPGVPSGSCPWERQGRLDGQPVRCVSWEAILWDYLHYLDEVPQASWRPHDHEGYACVRAALGEARVLQLQRQFRAGR